MMQSADTACVCGHWRKLFTAAAGHSSDFWHTGITVVLAICHLPLLRALQCNKIWGRKPLVKLSAMNWNRVIADEPQYRGMGESLKGEAGMGAEESGVASWVAAEAPACHCVLQFGAC